jgi:hypothetical protein
MPRVVTSIHDPVALAATCARLGLPPPVERAIWLDAEEVFGWVVRLGGLRYPVVCDTLSGLIAYHPLDNAHHRYACLMRFVERYYDVWAKLRPVRPGPAVRRERGTARRAAV